MTFPIRIKLFLTISSIVVISLLIYSAMMVGFFKEDKRTYIFDLNADISLNLSREVERFFSSNIKNMQTIADIYDVQQASQSFALDIKEIFINYDSFVGYAIYNKNNLLFEVFREEKFKNTVVGEESYYSAYIEERLIPIRDLWQGSVYIRNVTFTDELPVAAVAIPYRLKNSDIQVELIAIISTDDIYSSLVQYKSSEAYIVDKNGRIISHRDLSKVVQHTQMDEIEIVDLLLEREVLAGTLTYQENGIQMLGAYSYIKLGNLGVVVQGTKKEAYAAMEKLWMKVVNIGIFIIIIAFVTSIAFSGKLTAPLKKLIEGVTSIGQGNLDVRVEVSSGDEIGKLADGFNQMAVEIKKREEELKAAYGKLLDSEMLATCYLVGQKVSSTLELDKALKLTVRSARELLGVKLGLLFFYDGRTHILRQKAEDGIEGMKSGEDLEIKLDEGYITQNLKWYATISECSPVKEVLERKFGAAAPFVAAPLVMFERIYGFIFAIDKIVGEFSKHEVNLLNLFAAQAAIACENARIYEQTEFMAIRDPLTGLFNRNYFKERMKEEMSKAARVEKCGLELSYLMMDIDRFKSVNDKYGHSVGDFVLKEMAAILKEAVREYDIAIRYGGEEFMIVLSNTPKAGAMVVGERIRKAVENNVFKFESIEMSITVSIGIASLSDLARIDEKAGDKLIAYADSALYLAKQNGRNRVEGYGG